MNLLRHRPLRAAFKPLYVLHYRYLFGRSFPGAGALARAVRRFELETGRGDAPAAKERWDEEYRRGDWEFMRHLDEMARYSVIASLVARLRPGGAVLDVGCGEGILEEHLRPLGYGRYVGIDLSEAAVARASARAGRELAGRRARFVAANAERYEPETGFDAVVFNESAYYFEDPVGTVLRYRSAIAPGGVLVVSMFESRRAAAIRRALRSKLEAVEEVSIGGRRGAWVITCFGLESPVRR
ncbi:MAG: class I SAM-dependent methyltransferase [Acidobacteriota bacterium]